MSIHALSGAEAAFVVDAEGRSGPLAHDFEHRAMFSRRELDDIQVQIFRCAEGFEFRTGPAPGPSSQKTSGQLRPIEIGIFIGSFVMNSETR